MNLEDLLKIIEDDSLGLLKIKQKGSASTTSEDRLITSFKEINDYVREVGRHPEANSKDMREFTLYTRLESILTSVDKVSMLLEYDEFALLGATKSISSINDIFENDNLGLLVDDENSIFYVKNVPKIVDVPDYIAYRKPCKDFDKFEYLFKKCHEDLGTGKKILRTFSNEQQIKEGLFFVLKGVMVYVHSVGKKETKNSKVNARLRCIFENGTESDMLLRSLASELYKDGRRIFETDGASMEALDHITDEDVDTGYIYILRSLSNIPEIITIKDLYKIGFCKQSVEDRIKHSVDDPTFLMGKVAIVSTYKCYNLKPQKMEQLLHAFFGRACLEVDVYDLKGRRHLPREWFVAPLSTIENAVTLLINGEIIHYKYDNEKQEIVQK